MQRISASDGKDITIEYLYPYVVLTLKETFTAKSNGVFAQSTPSVTKIRNLHSWARRRAYPPLSYGSPPRGWNWQRVGASQKMMTAAAINAPLCSLCFRWKKKGTNAKWPKRSTIIVCRLCHFLALHKSKSHEDVYVLFQQSAASKPYLILSLAILRKKCVPFSFVFIQLILKPWHTRINFGQENIEFYRVLTFSALSLEIISYRAV